MTLSNQPPELNVVDDVEDVSQMPRPREHVRAPTFNLDDAFSLNDEDPAAAFDFDSDAFLKQLQSRVTLEVEENEGEHRPWSHPVEGEEGTGDLDAEGTGSHLNSTNASVSTLDIYATSEPMHTQSPKELTSSQSTQSDGSPSTPSESYPSPGRPVHENLGISPKTENIKIVIPSQIGDDPRSTSPPLESAGTEGPKSPLDRSISGSTLVSSNGNGRSREHVANSDPARDSQEASRPQPEVQMSTGGQPVPPKSRSNGPSVFQRVVSKTRPPYLPPKQKEEDIKHSKEWEQMMQQSRAAEQRRRDELQARRLAREQAIEGNMTLWERAILPDWKKAVKDPSFRKLWWEGVPTKLRSVVWEKAVGNTLAITKASYTSSLARARKLLAAGKFPTTALSLMESDIDTTLPQLHIFNRLTGPLYEDLRNLLCAWIVCRAEEGLGYIEGIAKIGGMLLLNLTGPEQAFVVMRNLLDRHCMRAFFGGPAYREDVEAYYRIFDTLLADGMPKVYFNFKQHQISPSEYLPDWILPLFLNHLPLEACSRIWDVLLLEGDAFLFRAALAVLSAIESRLFFPDRKELLDVLKGESRAALEVFRREAPAAFLGLHGEIIGPKYEIYGVNEETVWERITEMSEWWKESTWQRLIVRELPDL